MRSACTSFSAIFNTSLVNAALLRSFLRLMAKFDGPRDVSPLVLGVAFNAAARAGCLRDGVRLDGSMPRLRFGIGG